MSASPSTRVSTFFNLQRDQTTLDFVDVPIGNDLPVFLDPSRLRSMDSAWSTECISLLQHYFEALLRHVANDAQAQGMSLLSALVERNEFHLGFSQGLADGRAFGAGYAGRVWTALTKSKAAGTGLLRDLEDTCLFIDGVGPDRISDGVCNIIRGPLIRYTQDMCAYYGIPLVDDVPSGPLWDPETESWNDHHVRLPVTPFGKLLLVPKIAVRHRMVYDPKNYYTHYLLPAMQQSERQERTGLVRTLKDGRERVDKKALRGKYGYDKLAITEQTLRHPEILAQYRRDAKRTSQPMTHDMLAAIENIEFPRIRSMLQAVVDIPPGREHAGDYENAIEKLLSAVLFPSLSSPTKQHQIHDGRKRIDITYVNNPSEGFFRWLVQSYPAGHIFVECKNYGKEIGNPEYDQLAGRFSPSRGRVGILVCRSVQDAERVKRGCKDTAVDDRGYILVLTDDDLAALVDDYVNSNGSSDYPLLMSKFRELIT